MPPLCPEHEVLRTCCRVVLEPEHVQRLRALVTPGLGWELLERSARRHRVLALVATHLTTVCAGAIPAEVLASLRKHLQESARSNLCLAGELLVILQTLEAAGVPAVPFKGPVLGAQAYGGLSLRAFGDLDILVRPEAAWRVRDLLVPHGFREMEPLSPAGEREALRSGYNYALLLPRHPVSLEVHWRIVEPYLSHTLSLGPMWERLIEVPVGGQRARSFAPEDCFQVLCLHAAKHAWEQLRWIADVQELLRSCPGFDWDRLWSEGERQHSSRLLLLGPALAAEVLGTPLPKHLRDRMARDGAIPRLVEQVGRRLFNDAAAFPGAWELCPFHLRVLESPAHRVRYVLSLLRPTAAERERNPLPPVLAPLHYFRRPLRLLRRFGRRDRGTEG